MLGPLIDIAWDWGVRSFGTPHMLNEKERALRLVEEAVELCQAADVPQELVERVVKDVYARPKGNLVQEIGGVLMTAFLFIRCFATRHQQFGVLQFPEEYFLAELRRVLSKPPKHFADRNEEKIKVQS